MYSPNHLFELSQHNQIINQFAELWLRGLLDWEPMLFECAKALEKDCNRLVDEHNIRDWFIDAEPKVIPNYVLEKSLVPFLEDVKNPLQRQHQLIEAIVLINEYQKIIYKSVVDKITFSSAPVLVSRLNTEVNYVIDKPKNDRVLELNANDGETAWYLESLNKLRGLTLTDNIESYEV